MAQLKLKPEELGVSSTEIRDRYPHFREMLTQRQTAIIQGANQGRQQLTQQLPEGPGDVGDLSVIDLNTDYLLNFADRERKELLEIQDALARMSRGVYGICESCGTDVNVERLEKLPYARNCIDCQASNEARFTDPRLRRVPKL
ncbi:MAG: TraR/DksA C4-type zinc finger protein [Bdellovibrionota bacterium]